MLRLGTAIQTSHNFSHSHFAACSQDYVISKMTGLHLSFWEVNFLKIMGEVDVGM